MIVAQNFTDGILVTENFLRETLAQINDIGLYQIALRITAQYLNPHRAEKERVGGHLSVVKPHVTIVKRLGYRPVSYTGCSFHLPGKILKNGSR